MPGYFPAGGARASCSLEGRATPLRSQDTGEAFVKQMASFSPAKFVVRRIENPMKRRNFGRNNLFVVKQHGYRSGKGTIAEEKPDSTGSGYHPDAGLRRLSASVTERWRGAGGFIPRQWRVVC